jgi:metallophosphoesterase (TIGR00282 family)
MRIGFFGDVVGRSGREGLAEHLPGLRRQLQLEFVIINAENAAAGFGITESTAKELFEAGADCLTLGNHSWDQKEAMTYIVREPRMIRPVNYPAMAHAPGRGSQLFDTPSGKRVLVVNVLGRVFMDALDDPFAAVDKELEACPLGAVADAIVVDIHAEATSEKMAMGHFCDGRASLVVGTHSHVPTATRPTPGPAPTTTASSATRRKSRCAASPPASPAAATGPRRARRRSAASFWRPTPPPGSPGASSRSASAGGSARPCRCWRPSGSARRPADRDLL